MNLSVEIKRLNKRIKEIEKHLNIQPKDAASIKEVELFLKEKCQNGNALKVEAKHLYNTFIDWLDIKGVSSPISTRAFYEHLRILNVVLRRGNQNKVYVYGVALRHG
jgi:hypothetical protein